MFKLILDREYIDKYLGFLKDFNVEPTGVSSTSYHYLNRFSRPVVSSVFGEIFVPIRMLVSIRTDRTNELIVPDDGKFYTECTTHYTNEHLLDDLVLLSAKSIVDALFDCGEDIVKVIPRTAPLPVGACYIDNTFYVYTNVVIDYKLKNESFFKLNGCHYEKISDLTPTSVLETELIESLAIVYNINSEEVSTDVCNDDHEG